MSGESFAVVDGFRVFVLWFFALGFGFWVLARRDNGDLPGHGYGHGIGGMGWFGIGLGRLRIEIRGTVYRR